MFELTLSEFIGLDAATAQIMNLILAGILAVLGFVAIFVGPGFKSKFIIGGIFLISALVIGSGIWVVFE